MNSHAVLLDSDRASLGTATSLAQGSELTATNGFVLGASKTLFAAGTNRPRSLRQRWHHQRTGCRWYSSVVRWRLGRAGLFTGNIQFAGEFSPGTSPATVSIARTATLAPTATLRIEIGGTTFRITRPGGGQRQATLSGTLDLDLINGFQPALGDSFTVMTFGSRAGDFANILPTSRPPRQTSVHAQQCRAQRFRL